MERIPYAKPYLPVADQVCLLQARGMHISDIKKVEHCLQRVGYYRLSGYWYPFRHKEILKDARGREENRTFDAFRPQTEFSTVFDLYVFDKKLRLLFLDAIERIEVGLRVDIALQLGIQGALSHRDAASFNSYFSTVDEETGVTPHAKFLEKLDIAASRSKEDFVVSFRSKYSTDMPIWMCIELWDFGMLASIISGMRSSDLQVLADRYSLPRRNLLVSWTQSINFVRNICAHHGRLWNRPLVQQPSPTRLAETGLLDHLVADSYSQRRVYAVAAVLQYLLRTIHPASTWPVRLHNHLATFPIAQGISVRHMGFPEDWERLELWSLPLSAQDPPNLEALNVNP
jgi:abortive infection bacteriophage resistance protein